MLVFSLLPSGKILPITKSCLLIFRYLALDFCLITLPKTPSFEGMIPSIEIPLENIISVIDLSKSEECGNFTTLMFAYGISHLTKEDFDFLPMIEVLITKALIMLIQTLKMVW